MSSHLEMNMFSEFAEARQNWVLRLFISDSSELGKIAHKNLRALCDEYLAGRYDIEVVNINRQPEMAERYRIFQTPALLRLYPGPVKKVTGDLSDKQKVLVTLGLIKETRPQCQLFQGGVEKSAAA